MIELVLGGARSGKSRYAESVAKASGLKLWYIATAGVHDDEMRQRVEHHIAGRQGQWQTIEEPLALAVRLKEIARPDRSVLVDCLTLWLSNNLFSEIPNSWEQQRQQLLNVLAELPGQIILVSNEVGLGVVPMGEINRRFVDEAGRLHQAIAQRADKVTFVAAGLPLTLKS